MFRLPGRDPIFSGDGRLENGAGVLLAAMVIPIDAQLKGGILGSNACSFRGSCGNWHMNLLLYGRIQIDVGGGS